MSEVLDSSAIANELHELAAPIRERLERVEREISAAEAALRDLRDGRTQLRTALRAVDPTYEPESKPGRKPGGKMTGAAAPSTKAMQQVLALLEDNRDEFSNGDGFTSGRLNRRDGWPYSESYTKLILDALHKRGVIRLDHVGRGGAHVFVLV